MWNSTQNMYEAKAQTPHAFLPANQTARNLEFDFDKCIVLVVELLVYSTGSRRHSHFEFQWSSKNYCNRRVHFFAWRPPLIIAAQPATTTLFIHIIIIHTHRHTVRIGIIFDNQYNADTPSISILLKIVKYIMQGTSACHVLQQWFGCRKYAWIL